MELNKLLYTIGNLYSGTGPYAVKAVKQFENVEMHGPFSSENEANTYMHKLVETVKPITGPFASVEVVKIVTAPAGRKIVYTEGGYAYEENGASMTCSGCESGDDGPETHDLASYGCVYGSHAVPA